jgi:hypothetical protein
VAELKRYIVSDSTDIEDMFLTFLKNVLAVPLVDNVYYSPVEGSSKLHVDIVDNIKEREDNLCPAVFVRVGDTQWEDAAIDTSAGYADPAGSLEDASGTFRPVYDGSAKRTLFQGATSVSIEIRMYGRKPCARFTARLSKIMYGFSTYLFAHTNAFYHGGMTTTPPARIGAIARDAYASRINMLIRHHTAEDIPVLKDIVHQFFVSVAPSGTPLELFKIVDTKREV